MVFPCDRHLDAVDDTYFRGVTVRASPAVVFRWLCQLRVAPYSYDWLDNLGRQSPRALTPGLEQLALRQHVMSIFELVEFEPGRHLTIRTRRDTARRRGFLSALASRLAPEVAVTYLVVPHDASRTRLLMKVAVRGPAGRTGSALRTALAWGDLVMARRQLLNLRDLAEG